MLPNGAEAEVEVDVEATSQVPAILIAAIRNTDRFRYPAAYEP